MTEPQKVTPTLHNQRTKELDEAHWWEESPETLNEGLRRVAGWMSAGNASLEELVDVVDKPWHFSAYLAAAQLGLDYDSWEEDLTLRAV